MTGKNRALILAALAGAIVGGGAIAGLAATDKGPNVGDKAAIELIVRDYILNNPEIIPQAMERLQQREQGKVVALHRPELETPFAGAWAGAQNGDVVLVEFFDYACGYCRASVKDVDRLLAEDPQLKVVFREMPILSPESEQAARASLAAAKQGKFLDFHRKLFQAGPLSPASLQQTVKAQGIAEASDPAINEEIGKNLMLARKLGFSGTPTFVIGDRVIAGAAGYDALKSAIDEHRRTRAAGKAG